MKSDKKRQSPSIERQLALALISVVEMIESGGDLGVPATDARAVLKTHGYEALESIDTRVKRIEGEIAEALKAQDGAKLGQLGAMLDRAKKGLPPLATEKKTPQAPKVRKPRKKKGEADPVLSDDRKPESTKDDEPGWLTRHPEPTN